MQFDEYRNDNRSDNYVETVFLVLNFSTYIRF